MLARDKAPPTPTGVLLAICALSGFSFGVEAHHVIDISDAPQTGSHLIDLATLMALKAPPRRRALRLRDTPETYLLVGRTVRIETVAMPTLQALPDFFAGLRDVLWGWTTLDDHANFLVDVAHLLETHA